MTRSRVRLILAVLLLVSGVAFAAGAAAERSANEVASSPSETNPPQTERGTEGSGGETGAEPAQHTEAASQSETLLGINPESTALVVVGVAVSLLLAAAVWLSGARPVLLAALIFGVAFAALDIREAVHQAKESRAGLLAVAIVLAVMHAAIAAVAALALGRAEERPALA
jgi:hypothetical protein